MKTLSKILVTNKMQEKSNYQNTKLSTATVLLSLCISTAYAFPVDVPFGDLPAYTQNPLTGFVPWGPVQGILPFAASLEFLSIGLDRVTLAEDRFDFTQLETLLAISTINNRQAILRFYIDSPATTSAIPDYLKQDPTFKKASYTVHGNCENCSLIPDYGDPKLERLLINFVIALGRTYNGDVRIAALQIGLIGFWGEWHIWPLPISRETFPSPQFQARLLNLAVNMFNKTLLQVGINAVFLPVATQNIGNVGQLLKTRLGLVDDSLLSTVYDDFIGKGLAAIGAENSWQSMIRGGEFFPPLQSCLYGQNTRKQCEGINNNEAIIGVMKRWRVSYSLNQYVFGYSASGLELQHATQIAKALGYRFHIVRILYENTTLKVLVRNSGTAKSYVRTHLVARIANTRTCQVHPTDLSTIIPDTDMWLNYSIPSIVFLKGMTYRLQFSLHSSQILPSQIMYLSNVNTVGTGETIVAVTIK
jgi:hypothetical protein